MSTAKQKHEWSRVLSFFSEQNAQRPTRLGVFEPNRGAADDYWIECGLPLNGINVEALEDRLDLQLSVGTLDHTVRNAVRVSWQMTASGDEDGVDILDADGRTTVLRFERVDRVPNVA
jgi:hypothetical protein